MRVMHARGKAAGLFAALLAFGAAAAGCDHASAPRKEADALVEAERELAEGHYAQALRDLRKIPAASLPDDASRRRAAEVALKIRDGAPLAAAFLEAEAKGDPAVTEAARLLRAEALLRSGAFDEAEAALAELEKAGLRSMRWKVLFALDTAARGRRTEAYQQVALLVKDGCKDADARVLHAEEHLDIVSVTMRRLLEGTEGSTDPMKVQRALGRYLLRGTGDPRRAADVLAEVVRARPSESGRPPPPRGGAAPHGARGDLGRAIEEARGLRAEDPLDFEVTFALAEALGERGNAAAIRSGGTSGMGEEPFAEAIAVYEDLAGRRAPDAATAIRVLHGLARSHLNCIPSDAPEAPFAPQTHFRRCLNALERADALDPGGQCRDPEGRSLLADTYYLRGKASKWTHAGTMDHTEAVGWYEKAIAQDHLHLEATWDLGLLYYDLLRTPEYIRKCVDLWERHLEVRHRRGLPDLDPERMRMLTHARGLAAKGEGFPAGVLPGGNPPPGANPPPAVNPPKHDHDHGPKPEDPKRK